MLRNLLFVGILVVAATAPILLSNIERPEGGSFLSNLLPGMVSDEPADERDAAKASDGNESDGTLAEFKIDDQLAALLRPQTSSRTSDAETVVVPIPEALRFDITPQFVSNTWPRVSTQLSELELNGMRVPLITGTSAQDLHGSITYFFDRSHRMQRIQLRGFAGDAEAIAQFVQAKFNLREYASTGPRIFLSHYNNRPLSIMRIRNAPVLQKTDQTQQQELFIEINAPTQGAALSRNSTKYLVKMREADLL